MDRQTELKKIKSEIESKEAEKEKYEKKLSQLKNQEKKLKRMASLEARKRRNHRLIVRGVILESFIEGASEKSEEEIKEILQKVFQKADWTNRSVRYQSRGKRTELYNRISLRFSKGAIIHPKGCPCDLRCFLPYRE